MPSSQGGMAFAARGLSENVTPWRYDGNVPATNI